MRLLKRWKKKKCSPPYPQLHIEESLYLLLSGSIWCILIKKCMWNLCREANWSEVQQIHCFTLKLIVTMLYFTQYKFENVQNCCLIVIMFTLLGHCCRMLVCSCIKKIDWAQEPLTACSSLWGFNMLKDTIYYKVDMPHKYFCGKGHANHVPTSLSHNKGVEKQTLQWSQYCTSTVKIVIWLNMSK